MQIQDDKFYLNKTSHAVRAAQAVLQYGVGAMVDFPDQTLMTAAPEYWQTEIEKIYDERLEKLLDVDYFGIPASKDDKNVKEGISYVRFPEWYFCPKCRRFKPLKQWVKEYKNNPVNKNNIEKDPYMVNHMRCPQCRQELVVARIVTVCKNGHIHDFPWIDWVHCRNSPALPVCNNPELTISTTATSSEGLEGIKLSCKNCNASTTLKDAFKPNEFQFLEKKYGTNYKFRCFGTHPWKKTSENCMEFPKVIQRGSSSIYFPVTESSLVIPPYSSILAEHIQKSRAYSEFQIAKENTEETIKLLSVGQERTDMLKKCLIQKIKEFSEKIALEISVPKKDVEKHLNDRIFLHNNPEYTTSSSKYRYEEYTALNGSLKFEVEKYRDFKREDTNISEYNLPYIKNISLINKIREIQVLTGFSRINPPDKTLPLGKQSSVVCIKEGKTRWYPAYQVYGEGIFIEFEEDSINRWTNQYRSDIEHRVKRINSNYSNSYLGKSRSRVITAKFLLLHTISHLLLKQLSFECGYSIASLKERIYCDIPGDDKKMSGLFIYTANGDSEGTLGGLVRQGRCDLFPNIFKKAIESAKICSNDPVCSISEGQGRESLNLAACYSCSLIPETSCEEFNIFLDRAMVVGKIDNPNFGLYSKSLQTDWKETESFSQTSNIDQKNSESSNNSTKDIIIITESGVDEQDMDYHSIFTDLLQYAEAGEETESIKILIDNSEDFDIKEKPLKDCEFRFFDDNNSYKADLVWKKSQTLFFTQDNLDSFEAAKNSDWKCFFSKTENLKDLLLNSIKDL